MKRFVSVLLVAVLLWPSVFRTIVAGETDADEDSNKTKNEVARVFEKGTTPPDARLGKVRTLRDAYHPWSPPETLDEWMQQAQAIRERILVSNGLWPMPPRKPLKPVIHGTIDRDEYTIEKVYFSSHPGHYVTGNLYRPKQTDGRVPGVLCPHGHWPNGRFYVAGESKAKQHIEQGDESLESGAHYPLQARMVHLARMGCIVFHYDMVGYADSRQVQHRSGFTDAEAGLRLQNHMGLQTFNSIRALDFLLSLPDVDPTRIGVTGASGGGTQTFILCAVDPRPAVAFPAVMASTAMQGGCVCENASYLRIGLNNIAFAAVFAPKPMALSGADDWTIDVETKGLPELRQVYGLFGKRDLVHAKCYPQFKHNYNHVSRQMMYEWFNTHLQLGHESPIREREFVPVPPAELSVFDGEHSLPADAKSTEELRGYLTKVADRQLKALAPQGASDVDEYRSVVGTAARVMLDQGVPAGRQIETRHTKSQRFGDVKVTTGTAGRPEDGDLVPFVLLEPAVPKEFVLLWIDQLGKSHLFDDRGQPNQPVQRLLDAGATVASADLFLTGEFVSDDQPAVDVNQKYHGYTFGYNRPLLSNRVRDVLTVVSLLKQRDQKAEIHLAGTGTAGRWALLAAAVAGDQIAGTVADLGDFSFTQVESSDDPLFLPGALKYGDIEGLAALAVPTPLTVFGAKRLAGRPSILSQTYSAAGGSLTVKSERLVPDDIVSMVTEMVAE